MRASLMQTFDRLYIVNLHGNARRKETAPDGSPDENVFDIQQGVALLIAVKTRNAPNDHLNDNIGVGNDNADARNDNLDDENDNIGVGNDNADDENDNLDDGNDNGGVGNDNGGAGCESIGVRHQSGAQVFYSDLWGRREAKYDALRTGTLASTKWTPLNPQPHFEPVSRAAWAFRVGGYSVCEKWLSDRKGRVLSPEITTYAKLVSAIERTLELQEELNAVCAEAWGW